MATPTDRYKANSPNWLVRLLSTAFPNSIVLASGKSVTAPGGFVGNVTGNCSGSAGSAGSITGVTASAAELNLNDGAVAGTAVASKTLALGADKNVDTLAIADGGLSLGSGAGTPVTATAAELNNLDGPVAGTASASKAAVLGADKNLDVLAVADLKLGAGAGTSVTASAAEINAACDGVFKTFSIAAPVESPAGTSTTTITIKDTAGATLAGRRVFWAYLSDDANGDTLGTAFAGFSPTVSGGLLLGSFTGNIFQIKTASDGTADFVVSGGSATTPQYLICVAPDGALVASAAITFAP